MDRAIAGWGRFDGRAALLRGLILLAVPVLAALAALAALAGPAARAAQIRAGNHPLSCPDPSVVDASVGRYRYYLACTSDFAADAFPVRGSNDLVHWHFVADIFPQHHQPWWALPSPKGRYWAPALYRIDGRWVVYFAAQHNPKRLTLSRPGGARVDAANMMIGVAVARSLHGPWQTRVLHYRGQFNALSREQEGYGGVIDPSVVRDESTGQLYLFWAEQHSSIWATQLSPNGLTISPIVHQVMWTQQGWECATPRRTCVVEGPEEYYRNGLFYLFYSGASTWTGSYAVGVATSPDPMVGQFEPVSTEPALRSGATWVGPGGSSAPVTAPDGETEIFYHATRGPDNGHVSADRYLFSSPLTWAGTDGLDPTIGSGQVR